MRLLNSKSRFVFYNRVDFSSSYLESVKKLIFSNIINYLKVVKLQIVCSVQSCLQNNARNHCMYKCPTNFQYKTTSRLSVISCSFLRKLLRENMFIDLTTFISRLCIHVFFNDFRLKWLQTVSAKSLKSTRTTNVSWRSTKGSLVM